MRFRVFVEVGRRQGIADPQAATIERALPALGFDDVTGMATGKAFRFDVDAASRAAATERVGELCRRFLTNPVIEDARITVEDGP
ncbi:MAG: phosphoribosylformylglycinamidine synthase subunit PurS [Actinomycetota bacterium]|nr:phosphoribosylformylglycinamidine synthase subunit PurS [Actinomycetota bacterium]